MFGVKKLGEQLAGALEGMAAQLEQGKVTLSPDPRDNGLMVRTIMVTLKMVATAIRQVAVE